ncbi:chromosome partitioning protein ParB [Actinophytocola sp.]|uniref:chromosome partitioning protein ParB n=1 Tax=Actinophytocola sp. TaxID=1872138 RepID=UPI002D7EEB21|nr:chromosome partitioning protein ParB [Actinophytocola sp.]HET9140675.1 chromosome partitioning protein ParB [Actinophytocola sp.]
MGDTGFSIADAEHDFVRARRRQVLSRLATWVRNVPDDVDVMLPFDEVIGALGRVGERPIGLRTIALDSIVGSVDRTKEFDRRFRPTSASVRDRWQRLALAHRRGEAIPPIEVYRVGELHFVYDGHHRVSVARALDLTAIDAYVTVVATRLSAVGIAYRSDLTIKDLRRIFLDRVPLTGRARAAVELTDPWDYAELAESIEAWGFRLMQHEGGFLDRGTVAQRWYDEEFVPVVDLVRNAGLIGAETDAEAYMRTACQRYRLVRTHRWDEDVIAALREADQT